FAEPSTMCSMASSRRLLRRPLAADPEIPRTAAPSGVVGDGLIRGSPFLGFHLGPGSPLGASRCNGDPSEKCEPPNRHQETTRSRMEPATIRRRMAEEQLRNLGVPSWTCLIWAMLAGCSGSQAPPATAPAAPPP